VKIDSNLHTHLVVLGGYDDLCTVFAILDKRLNAWFVLRVFQFGNSNNKTKKLMWRSSEKWKQKLRCIDSWVEANSKFLVFTCEGLKFRSAGIVNGATKLTARLFRVEDLKVLGGVKSKSAPLDGEKNLETCEAKTCSTPLPSKKPPQDSAKETGERYLS
jgi:hypothetical protein